MELTHDVVDVTLEGRKFSSAADLGRRDLGQSVEKHNIEVLVVDSGAMLHSHHLPLADVVLEVFYPLAYWECMESGYSSDQHLLGSSLILDIQ